MHPETLMIIGVAVLVIAAVAFVLTRFYDRSSVSPQDLADQQEPQLEKKGELPEYDEKEQALTEAIGEAGAQAVAASYGEPHQAEISFDPNKKMNWNQRVRSSLERRVGKENAHIKRRTTPAKQEAEAFLLIYLMAPRSQKFAGDKLYKALREQGLVLNKDQVFEAIDSSGVSFYVSSILSPGTFDMNSPANYKTPGINFIIDLKQSVQPKKAFQRMLKIVDKLSQVLDADVLDHHRQRMTHASLGEYIARIDTVELLRKHDK